MTEQEQHDLLIRLDERTQRILEQTTKTNGRVTKLEGKVDFLESAQDTAAGVKSVWVSIRKTGFEIIKLAGAAFLGAALKK